MDRVTLGSTGITTNKNGFGALPIQRDSVDEAVRILRKAYDGGITFFDTARAYTDSEEKVGIALSGVRDKIFIATKSHAKSGEELMGHIKQSLSLLKTDYIDVYQFHNPSFCPKPGDGTGLYEAALELKGEGKIRHIGITNHRQKVAKEAILSGLYETLQFPFSYLASDEDVEIVRMCKERNMGFIAMKSLSGGLITDSKAAYAYAMQFDNVLPIWGIQKESELDEFLSYSASSPKMDDGMTALIEKDRKMLSGSFCRGCGYCMPCPQGIEINNLARLSLLLRRSPSEKYLTDEYAKHVHEIDKCTGCRSCAKKCPYSLDTPSLLKRNLKDYDEIRGGKAMTPDNF